MADLTSEQKITAEKQSEKVYQETAKAVNGVMRENPLYSEILEALRNGDATVELRKRYMLRAIDETWVTVIEDSLTALDEVTRRPGRFIEEQEEVLPIELTKTISNRSIKDLAQHTDYISEVDGDDIIPSKLLNVFREETVQTYENKFINTLIYRMYSFVRARYDSALSCGVDVKNTMLEYNNSFTHDDVKGKIHFRVELEETPKAGEVEKNYVFVSDLWRRVRRLNQICDDYMSSPFVTSMGKNYIRPPVMRTNAILKNKNMRQCLALWEFIESYESSGYSMMVQDTLMDMSEQHIRELYSTMSMEYLIFRHHVEKGFDSNEELARASFDAPLAPEIVEDLTPAALSEFALHIAEIDETAGERTVEENEVLRALEVALLADELLQRRAELEEFQDKYDRSFMARLILAQEPAQTFYTEIKNCLLSYKNVRDRISWKHETFSYGRGTCARLAVKGKTLVIYLPLDPTDERYRTYHVTDMSEFVTYKNLKLCLKIRSRRAVGIAIKLIAEVMERLGAQKLQDFTPQDYHYPLETKEQLIARGLIKVNNKIVGTDEVAADEETVSQQEEPVELDETVEADDTDDEVVAEGTSRTVYQRSFLARLTLAQEPSQTFYTVIKNHLLSYKKLKSRVSWKYDTFSAGRILCARLLVRGKTLMVCLPLDPADEKFSHYHVTDMSQYAAYSNVPFGLKIRSARAAKHAIELINLVMQYNGIVPRKTAEYQDYHMPLQNREQLVEQGLIKVKVTTTPMFLDNLAKSTETQTEVVEQPQQTVQPAQTEVVPQTTVAPTDDVAKETLLQVEVAQVENVQQTTDEVVENVAPVETVQPQDDSVQNVVEQEQVVEQTEVVKDETMVANVEEVAAEAVQGVATDVEQQNDAVQNETTTEDVATANSEEQSTAVVEETETPQVVAEDAVQDVSDEQHIEDEQQQDEDAEEKRGFFSRLFGRKKNNKK